MHLLIVCAGSWLILLGTFVAAWTGLPTPRSSTDIVVIVVIGAAVLAFSRLGLGALLALSLRALPDGRLRTAALAAMLRIMPTMLRSSALAAASATLAVQAAHGAPMQEPPHLSFTVAATAAVDDPGAVDDPTGGTNAPAPDPGWPTSPGDEHPPRDPSWPTDAPAAGDSPVATPPSQDSPTTPPDDRHGQDEPADTDADAPSIHIVGEGESLWSIAQRRVAPEQGIEELVADIYADNRQEIGPNPNLIMPGQRLEIAP